MVSKAQLEASKRYDKENCIGLYLKLNLNTDKEIINHLKKKKNKQGYIKLLIKRDMKGTK